MALYQLRESKHFCVSTVVRIVLLMFASISIIVCAATDDSVAQWDLSPSTAYVGVFKTEISSQLTTLDQSLLGFLDDAKKNGVHCDAKLAQAMQAFVVLSAVAVCLATLSAVPFRDMRLLNASIVLGVVASVFQSVAIALWVAFRHIECTWEGSDSSPPASQALFPDGSDTYGIVLMSISLVFIVASVPLGVYSRTAHKEAFSYVSIQ